MGPVKPSPRSPLRRGRRLQATAAVFSAVVAVLVAAAPASPAARDDGGTPVAGPLPAPGIRLVLQITVDQLRGDLAARVRDRWSRGGFRRLHEQGAVFTDAHHRHANTETVVGHATLATGADPSVHGMVGNAWLERATGRIRYTVEDERFPLVGGAGASAEPPGRDGARSVARTEGRSPEALLAPTLADAIANAGRGAAGSDGPHPAPSRAEVWSLSLKDRAAIAMGGRSARSLWWSNDKGEFVSSTWYFPDGRLPSWVVAWNDAHPTSRFDGRTWDLLLPAATYLAAGRDDAPWELPLPGMGRTFPHRFDREAMGDGFHRALAASPFGDRILLDFARELLRKADVGRDDTVDYVSVSFSSLDWVGHYHGPQSLEAEDALLRLDRSIEALLDTVDEEVGLEHVLVVLSSDHGVAEPPGEVLAEGGDAGRVSLAAACASPAAKAVAARAGCEPVARTWPPYVYLDRAALAAHGADAGRTADALASVLAKTDGVSAAFAPARIDDAAAARDPVALAVRRSFHPDRSGDVHVVTRSGWQFVYEGPAAAPFATGHGTPWRSDSFVPLVFTGPGVPRASVDRRVETVDVAPTIAALLGIAPPAAATGAVLAEALPRR